MYLLKSWTVSLAGAVVPDVVDPGALPGVLPGADPGVLPGAIPGAEGNR